MTPGTGTGQRGLPLGWNPGVCDRRRRATPPCGQGVPDGHLDVEGGTNCRRLRRRAKKSVALGVSRHFPTPRNSTVSPSSRTQRDIGTVPRCVLRHSMVPGVDGRPSTVPRDQRNGSLLRESRRRTPRRRPGVRQPQECFPRITAVGPLHEFPTTSGVLGGVPDRLNPVRTVTRTWTDP